MVNLVEVFLSRGEVPFLNEVSVNLGSSIVESYKNWSD